MASSIAFDGRVTVSLRKSIGGFNSKGCLLSNSTIRARQLNLPWDEAPGFKNANGYSKY
jgi:hypothetical protein